MTRRQAVDLELNADALRELAKLAHARGWHRVAREHSRQALRLERQVRRAEMREAGNGLQLA